MTAPEFLSPVWSHLTQIQPQRGEGIYLYDAEGRRYADFTSGIGVTNTGHCHPEVVAAIKRQAEALLFGQMNIVIAPVFVKLSEMLNRITPAALDRFFFSNSGAEAVEASVKLARHATGRRNIVVFQGSFHGRTYLTMAMSTSKYIYRHHYQPLPAGIFVAPFPDPYYYGWDESETSRFCLQQLERLLYSQSAPDETAAIVIEPILGEGGYVPAPLDFLRELRALCDRHEILLIFDEVQTGFGRTGRMFCFEHAGIAPDILVMAKGLASGLPISAIGASADLMKKWRAGTHGGTYGGGSTLAAAAACATIEVLQKERLVDNAAQMGKHLMERLCELQHRYPAIGEVRGRGLMIGTEFTNPNGEPDRATAKAVQQACLKRDLLLLTCGTRENVIRWVPPLIVTREQIDAALAVFEEALTT